MWQLLLALWLGGAAPDPRLTPGAIASNDPATVCAPGYDLAHRAWPWPAGKRVVLAEYGIPWSRAHDYEDDDLVPVALGGDNLALANHWPQRCDAWEGSRCVRGPAADKDRVEWRMIRAVCYDHTMTLKAAQSYFLHWGQR